MPSTRLPLTTKPWTRYLVDRSERPRTTWALRFSLVSLVIAALWLTNGWWTAASARGLVCQASLAPSDAILIENFDPDYLLFERARQLRQAGLARRVFVPIRIDRNTSEPQRSCAGYGAR